MRLVEARAVVHLWATPPTMSSYGGFEYGGGGGGFDGGEKTELSVTEEREERERESFRLVLLCFLALAFTAVR